jgi:SWI/SNF-related matrix-associated actin-dependent regulator of chromatin subfamily A member 5
LFEGVEAGPPFVEGEHLVTNSGKLVVLDKLLKKLKPIGSRVLIFSQMTRMLDIIEDYLEYRGYLFCRIDGNTPQEEREQQIEEFNAPNSKKFCFLLSTRAGGLGINLATADTVVLFDSDWNPQMDLQAMDRAHRIGQKKQVMVYRLVMQDTIEQKIVERAEAKLYLDALIIQQGRLVEKHQNASSSELLQMVKFGADTIFQGGADSDYQLTDADIDSIIALGKKKGEEFSEKLKSANLSLANFSLEGLTAASNLYEHDGQDFSALQRQRNLLTSWIAPPKRETKVSTYNENVLLNPNQKQRVRAVGPPTRPPRQHVILPHQFLPDGLSELFEIETKRYIAEYHLRVAEAKGSECVLWVLIFPSFCFVFRSCCRSRGQDLEKRSRRLAQEASAGADERE